MQGLGQAAGSLEAESEFQRRPHAAAPIRPQDRAMAVLAGRAFTSSI